MKVSELIAKLQEIHSKSWDDMDVKIQSDGFKDVVDIVTDNCGGKKYVVIW